MGEHTIHYNMLLMPGNGQLTRDVHICNEGRYLKIHTLVHIYFLGMVKPIEKKRKKKELEFNF